MADQYEKLRRKGYKEEPIVLDGPLSEMDLFASPMSEGRVDKGVVVTDPSGISMRTSSIMMGYNKQGIKLDNGEYISWEEAEEALELTMAERAGERDVVFVCKKTGKIVEPEQIVSMVHDIATDKPYLYRSPSGVIKNQTSQHISIFDKDVEYPKGVSMLGNDGIQLTTGEYVSRKEVEQALKDYAMMVEPEREYEIIERCYRQFTWIPTLIAAVLLVLSGMGKEEIIADVQNVGQNLIANYAITLIKESSVDKPTIFDYEEENGPITIGNSIFVDTGVPYYESSDYQYGGADQRGVVGGGIRDEGLYTVDSFSILYNGTIIECEWQEGVELSDLLEEQAKALDVSVEDLQPMLHIGGPVSGWVDVNDFINSYNQDGHLDKIKVILDNDASYCGIIEDLSSDYITINVDGQEVNLNIRNEDGSFVEAGDIVVGSDGKSYLMNDFSIEKNKYANGEKVVVGSMLNWSVKNITDEEALLVGCMAGVATYLSLRKRKDMVDMSDSEIEGLVFSAETDFEAKRREFGSVSTFEDAVKRLTGIAASDEISAADILKKELIEKKITVENITNMSENRAGGEGKKV